MIALLFLVIVVVAMLAVLVVGLLRSHADILRSLHDLGVGVGDPSESAPHHHQAPSPQPVPLHMGPPLPGERSSTSAPDLSGLSPTGDAVAVAVTGVAQMTLLAFLSSGCATCAGFWQALQQPMNSGFPADVRVVAVTKGPEFEIPSEVARRSNGAMTVVMSTEAWGEYEVPGSPFFVLIDGPSGRRLGEGVANRADQVADLVRRARADDPSNESLAGPAFTSPSSGGRAHRASLDGPERETLNDRELTAAGIVPGDPSLYPQRHEDLFAPPYDNPSSEESPRPSVHTEA